MGPTPVGKAYCNEAVTVMTSSGQGATCGKVFAFVLIVCLLLGLQRSFIAYFIDQRPVKMWCIENVMCNLMCHVAILLFEMTSIHSTAEKTWND